MSSSSSGGIGGIGTVLFLIWIFGGFDSCGEDKKPTVEVKVEEAASKLDETVSKINNMVKDVVKGIKPEAKNLIKDLTESEEEKGSGTLLLVKPESAEKEEVEKTDLAEIEEEEEIPETEEFSLEEEEIIFTPL